MIGLLFIINLIIMHSYARESNDKVYKILRDFSSTLHKANSESSINELKQPEHTTKVDILSVLHDIGTIKEIVDNEKKVIIKDQDGVKKEAAHQVERTDERTWLADLFNSPKDIKVKELTDEKKDDVTDTPKNDLKDVLLMLIKVLEELNKTIAGFNVGSTVSTSDDGFMMMKLPFKKHKRSKRDAGTNNSTHLVVNEIIANETVSTNNTSGNISSNAESGRRNMNLETPLEVKEKLLAYLNESFSEIKLKVEPINNLKMAFGNNNDYKIGYVVANIDALEANLGKLEKDMEVNKRYWDDRTILEVFDKLKVSNNVVTSLLESLRVFVKSKPHY